MNCLIIFNLFNSIKTVVVVEDRSRIEWRNQIEFTVNWNWNHRIWLIWGLQHWHLNLIMLTVEDQQQPRKSPLKPHYFCLVRRSCAAIRSFNIPCSALLWSLPLANFWGYCWMLKMASHNIWIASQTWHLKSRLNSFLSLFRNYNCVQTTLGIDQISTIINSFPKHFSQININTFYFICISTNPQVLIWEFHEF